MNKTVLMVAGAAAAGILVGYVLQSSIDAPGRLGNRIGLGQEIGNQKSGDGRQDWQGQRSDQTSDRMGRGQGDGQGMMGGGQGRGMGMNRESCVSDDCLAVDGLEYPAGELSADAKEALKLALNDEYRALATYDVTIDALGNVRPFSMIRRAEEQHIASLKALFDKYGLTIPGNTYVGTVTAPANLAAACQVGVDAEKTNASLYRGTLLPKVTTYPDLTQVFTHLMEASENRHLPAFERCN